MATKEKQLIDELRKQVHDLKEKLNLLDEEKEGWFEKRECARKEIFKLINEIRQSKAARDSLTKKVKDAKKRRNELNAEIKKRISEFNDALRKKKELAEKYKITVSPEQLLREIESIEFKIETEGIPFEKEQKLMKVIKQKKAEAERAIKVSSVFGDSKKLSAKIDELKREAETVHRGIQGVAKESQEKHEKMVSLSKTVNELRTQETDFAEKFLVARKGFSETNDLLQQKLAELSKIKGALDHEMLLIRKNQELTKQRLLEEKERAVEEKIKSGKKLTTRDLLVFQQE